MLIVAANGSAAAEPKRVLLLHSFGPQFVPWVFFAGQLREELFRQPPDKIDLYEASLEGSRFQQPDAQGPVGGPMLSSEEVGRRMAQAAVRILSGETPGDLKIPPVALGAPQYDRRELQHWNISEDRLPTGSIVRFSEPTAWEQYRLQISLICAVILLQGAMIFGLVFERRRRIHAEVQSRQHSVELAHINRYSVAGELLQRSHTRSTSRSALFLANIETAELMVKSPTPDLKEIGEILADIRRDDERASEVIGRLRSLLKKASFELKQIDLNEVVDETMRFLSALAIAREVELTGFIAPVPLPVKGDRIQLQQVILNLIVNAMDAMSGMPGTARRITVSTAPDGCSAHLSVSDVGPGIPSGKLEKVFEPFFTTKPEGMGMGLSIARTIIAAHGGRLSAENRAGRGAAFRITLPLAAAPT